MPSHLSSAQLLALLDSADQLTSEISLADLLERILATAERLTGAQAGSIFLHDSERNDLYFAAVRGPVGKDQLLGKRVPIDGSEAGNVYRTQRTLMENHLAEEDYYTEIDRATSFSTKSMICTPLTFAGTPYGVLQILNKAGDAAIFDETDRELAERLALQATIAIRNATLFERTIASSGLYARPTVCRDLVATFTAGRTVSALETVTVLFADMRGFSQLCHVLENQLEARDHLSQFLLCLSDAVIEHDGIVNKFIGDGIMAIFRRERSVEHALRCAFAIVERFKNLRLSWEQSFSQSKDFLDVGIGIATGSVFFGLLGNEKISDFTVIGNTVNLAAGLERHARDGKHVLCDTRTFATAKGLIERHERIGGFAIAKPGQRITESHTYDIYNVLALKQSTSAIAPIQHVRLGTLAALNEKQDP